MHAFDRERKKESAAMKLRKNMCINSKRVQGKHKNERMKEGVKENQAKGNKAKPPRKINAKLILKAVS